MELTARIVEWNQNKGYGFVELDSGRLFLHIRDFSRRQRPEIGDVVRFRMGEDARGRKCAVNVKKIEQRGGMGLGSALVLALLLILPVLAVRQIAVSAKVVAGYAMGITVITWFMYFHDKKRAESGGWRVPESTLHLLEVLGGWPSAFVAQRWLRHKIPSPTSMMDFLRRAAHKDSIRTRIFGLNSLESSLITNSYRLNRNAAQQ